MHKIEYMKRWNVYISVYMNISYENHFQIDLEKSIQGNIKYNIECLSFHKYQRKEWTLNLSALKHFKNRKPFTNQCELRK